MANLPQNPSCTPSHHFFHRIKKHHNSPTNPSPAFQTVPNPITNVPSPTTILLTGSTGNLGCYLLDNLLANPNVRKVYCLNRSDDAAERQRNGFTFRGLATGELEDKGGVGCRVEFLKCDLSRKDLGLSEGDYGRLKGEVGVVLHNAWPVDFNLSLPSFAPHITGVRNLITLILSTPYHSYPPTRHSHNPSMPSDTTSLPLHNPSLPSRPPIQPTLIFISSISVAANYTSLPGSRTKVPETEILDWKLARLGYGQSKLIAERLIAEAGRVSGVKGAVVRVGQVAGPVGRVEKGKRGGMVKGQWPKREWVGSLVESSGRMGMLPGSLGPVGKVDWVPVDVCAGVVGELVMGVRMGKKKGKGKGKGGTEWFHVVNPKEAEWKDVLPAIVKWLPEGTKIVDLPTWVEELRESVRKGEDLERNPAAKLMPFFENLADKAVRFPKARAPTLDTKKTVGKSGRLRELEKINEGWMELWMRQWAFEW